MPPNSERPFTRATRLRARKQFMTLREQGRAEAGRRLVVRCLPAPDGQKRLSAVISKRYSLLAVRRNRARRLIREAGRQFFPEMGLYWVIVFPRAGMLNAKLQEILPEFRRLLTRLGVIASPPPPAVPQAP
ncbi:MAG: ribonuclease P protein component [Lentisphaeria bacterium]